ncbi:alkaline phosphatase D family protein [Kribbia dieselivorans]|uniref:alkaline phosphatase D family protein n=1 Tax=Kribbia dieselivorans TaxID=331526 RepID=UPI0008389B07|nr:alkaline phosphatase D family protein [Kribbia dieselivorans]
MGIPELPLSRRTALTGAAAGAAALLVPFRSFDPEAAAAPAKKGIFGYGVASGDPTATSVIIWTRATPPMNDGRVATPGSGLGAPLNVKWEVAADANFRSIVRKGHVKTSADSDHTVKVDVTGLDVYTRYFYRFSTRGETSPVGRTQTAGDEKGTTHALRLALVSCSNYTGGYFSAYRSIAKRDDLDLVLHVGDYIYEYGNGSDRYGPAALKGVRDAQPAHEILTLADYRLRHALHKADPDAQAAHRQHPWTTIFDDHEVANDTWADGAENHEAGEGDFQARRRVAMQAYLEWLPFRMPDQSVSHRGVRYFKRFTYGDLADLQVMETRQNRSEQIGTKGSGFLPATDPATIAAVSNPARHLPEPEQMAWVKDGLATPRRWHLVAQQTIMTRVNWPGEALGAPAGSILFNGDQWDGYRNDQAEIIGHMAAQPAGNGDTVVLTGDIHSSWAADLVHDGTPMNPTYTSGGVEFVCPSVSSDGFYEIARGQFPTLPAEAQTNLIRYVEGGITQINPWIKYVDGVGHGYVVVDVTRERVQADFHLTPVPTTAQPDPRVVASVEPAYVKSMQTLAGTRRVQSASGPIGPRSDSPRTAGKLRGPAPQHAAANR